MQFLAKRLETLRADPFVALYFQETFVQHVGRITKLGELLPAASAVFVIPIVSSLAKYDPAEADTIQVQEIIEPPVSRVGHLCFIIPHAKAISCAVACRFSARNGWLLPYHRGHLGSFVRKGPGLKARFF
jgi:hypothetical protein